MKNPANKLNIDTPQSLALPIPPFEKRQACLSENKLNTPTSDFIVENADNLYSNWMVNALKISYPKV